MCSLSSCLYILVIWDVLKVDQAMVWRRKLPEASTSGFA